MQIGFTDLVSPSDKSPTSPQKGPGGMIITQQTAPVETCIPDCVPLVLEGFVALGDRDRRQSGTATDFLKVAAVPSVNAIVFVGVDS